MKTGTKSVLIGAHCFFIHPFFLALAWWILYGFPRDWRLWLAFFVHDIGYWGKSKMDDDEGELHPIPGALIMAKWADKKPDLCGTCLKLQSNSCWDERPWAQFTLLHSRFMARRCKRNHSRLCVADKLATCLMPWWLYLPMVNLTGEIHEYMDIAHAKEGGKYSNMERLEAIQARDQRAWFQNMTIYMRAWVEEHKDCRPDTWTTKR